MRFLLLLPWCFLLSLAADCGGKMPTDPANPVCTQTIKWQYRNDKQATATCLEYFATTFAEGKRGQNDNEIECTVSRQFQCDFVAGSVPIFDKCYTFSTEEVTMEKYLKNRHEYCKNGKDEGGIPVFFTMTQAKHIAMKAHRENLFKMWVNVNKDGRTIENSGTLDKGFMLYKEQWKVDKDYYWKGSEVVRMDKNGEEPVIPKDAEYLFFRTRTDTVYNLWQGSFERATKDATASIVCEYQAKIIPEQEKYCAKLQKLGLNAQYNDGTTSTPKNSRTRMHTIDPYTKKTYSIGGKKRCIYTSLTTYSLDGTKKAIEDFTGCDEKPSKEHSSGLDNGEAHRDVYKVLTKAGAYRIAAIKTDMVIPDAEMRRKYRPDNRALKHCNGPRTSGNARIHQEQWDIYDHFNRKDFVTGIEPDWEDMYPKDECSDFPTPAMDSKALALRKGLLIDVPTPVRLPVLCSIASNVDCAYNPDVCSKDKSGNKRDDLVCKDTTEWNKDTRLYAECVCPRFHKEDNGVCKWLNERSLEEIQLSTPADSCGRALTWGSEKWVHVPFGGYGIPKPFDEEFIRVVVRNTCTMSIFSLKEKPNYALLENKQVGMYVVPSNPADTLYGWEWQMSASQIECTCTKPELIDP